MSAGTLDHLLALLSAPEKLPQDAQGLHHVKARVGTAIGYAPVSIKAVKDRGFVVVWDDTQNARIYRAATTTVPAEMAPGTRPLGKNDFVRDTAPDLAQLTKLARWLFDHYTYGTVGHMDVPEGVARSELFLFRRLRGEEADEHYWNDMAEQIEACGCTAITLGIAKRRIYPKVALPKISLGLRASPRYAW